MGDYKTLTLENAVEWNLLLGRIPIDQQDVYYQPQYYSLYENLGDGIATCFVYYENNDIALYPFLLNSVNKAGYELDEEYFDIQGAYGYNGVITTNNSDSFAKNFHKALSDYCFKNNIIAEFTRFHPIFANHLFSRDYMNILYDRKTVFIDLNQPYSNIFNCFQTTTKKQIKRATSRYNIKTAIFSNNDIILKDFISIYYDAMDRAKSIPYLYFSEDYFYELITKVDSKFFFAYLGEKPVAAISVLVGINLIHGHLGGALTEYLNVSPYSLLYSEIIKFGQSQNRSLLHLGGGTTNDAANSLLSFKLNFSKKTADFYLGKKTYNQKIYDQVVDQWFKKKKGNVKVFDRIHLKYRF